MPSFLGIDLGNSTCKVSIATRSDSDTFSISTLLPSVSSPTSQRLGQPTQSHIAPGSDTCDLLNEVASLKRLLGNSVLEAGSLQREPKFVKAPLVEAGGIVGVEVACQGPGEVLSPKQLLVMLLQRVYELGSKQEDPVINIVISVPAWYTDSQRRTVLDASATAGLCTVGLINDTTAVALNYGIEHLDLPESNVSLNTIFVDIGQSDCSIVAVAFSKGEMLIKSVICDPHLGGRDIDHALALHFAKELHDVYKVDVLGDVTTYLALLAECQEVKKTLSVTSPAPFHLHAVMSDISGALELTRELFEKITADLISRIPELLHQALQDAGFTREDIKVVELVGSSSAIPAIRNCIRTFFDGCGTGVSATISRDYAVSNGAAYACTMIPPHPLNCQFTFRDLDPYPFTVRWENQLGQLNWTNNTMNDTLDRPEVDPDPVVSANETTQSPDSDVASQLRDVRRALAEIKAGDNATTDSAHRRVTELEQRELVLLRELVTLELEDSQRRGAALFMLGLSLHSQFENYGKMEDLNEAIDVTSEAVALSGDDDPVEPDDSLPGNLQLCFYFLATMFDQRYKHLGNPADLDKVILNQEISLCMMPTNDPDVPTRLCSLGYLFLHRFKQVGSVSDVDSAVLNYETALHGMSDSDPIKSVMFANLGLCFAARFERLGNNADIDSAILSYRAGLRITSDDTPEFPEHLSYLGTSLRSRFQCLKDVADIQEAVLNQERAVHLLPDTHPSKPGCLSNLGNSLLIRFYHSGAIADVEQAVFNHQAAVNLTDNSHTDMPGRLVNLGKSRLDRFERLGDIADLHAAVSNHRSAVEKHPYDPPYLSNFGSSLMARFKRTREITDLNEAVLNHESAVRFTPWGHPTIPSRVHDLATSLLCRFGEQGNVADLNQAILNLEPLVGMLSEGHPMKLALLTSLGNSLMSRFERLGSPEDIDKGIMNHRAVLRMAPHDDTSLPERFSNLGSSLLDRFGLLGELQDLTEAIDLHENAVQIMQDDHPHKPGCLFNLGNALLKRYKRLGDIADIDGAILHYKAAVSIALDDDPKMPSYLTNLGTSLRGRFERIGNIPDLDDAISNQEIAVCMTPDDHPDMPARLVVLGNSLLTRGQLEDNDDLDEAIVKLQTAIRIMPDDHPDKSVCWCSLANALSMRSSRRGDIADLNEAISTHEAGIRDKPTDHPGLLAPLINLGRSFMNRYIKLKNVDDLNQAILTQEAALRTVPAGHPAESTCLNNLGTSLLSRFQLLEDTEDCQKAVVLFSKSAKSLSPPSERFTGACFWSWAALLYQPGLPHDVFEAYTCALRLLPRLAWLGVDIGVRYRTLLGAHTGSTVACNGAAVAVTLYEEYEQALEWLEQGRTIVWAQTLQLRAPLDDLRAFYPALATKLEQVSKDLESGNSQNDFVGSTNTDGGLSTEEITRKQHQLALEWDRLTDQVQELPGFEHFLQPKPYSQLRHASIAGPVIVVNVSELGCSALILVSPSEPLRHVSLPDFSYKRACSMQSELHGILSTFGLRSRSDESHGRPSMPTLRDADEIFRSILAELWTAVAQPVLGCLSFQALPSHDLPRIWWCPTGPLAFLPLHAAGLYDEDDAKSITIADFAISSYTPSLSALLAASSRKVDEGAFKLLTLIQEFTPLASESPLPGVVEELKIVRNRVSKHPILGLEGTEGTVAGVLSAMEECSWVHLACHGVQDIDHPTESGLILQDGLLKLSDIIKKPLPLADFAFLSACQTATGYDDGPDEAIHLAAGMLLAGYRSVIATMWSIGDDDAPRVADIVYSRTIGDGQPNSLKAAQALHEATRYLRKRYNGEMFLCWVPFIHMGV